jgi:CheY-like chemotaxis protein
MLRELFSFEYTVGGYVKVELTMMLFEKGPENNIRCRAINGWFKMDSYVSSREKLLLEIKKLKPDVVLMDIGLYEKIDGIETSRMIRSRFDVPVMYV